MIGRLINLPFKVLGRVSRAVQDRNDLAMKAQHGQGEAGDDYSAFDNADRLFEALPADLQFENLDMDPAKVLTSEKRGAPVLLVDVRRPAAFKGGHIPDAAHIPLGALHIRLAELPPDQRIVVYCDDGRASRDAVMFLRFRGLEDTWVLAGGMAAWRRAGGSVTGGGR